MDCVQTDHRTPRFLFPLLRGLLFLPLGFLLSGSAQGQTPRDRVLGFLDSASGFHLLGTIQEGELAGGQTMRITATFLEGADYMVVGFCDEDCTNLDLTLFDPLGNETENDRLPDPEPILWFTAEETGSFDIQVDAVDCGETTCGLAIGILGSTAEPGAAPGEDMASRLLLVGGELRTLGFLETQQDRRGALGSDQDVSVPVNLDEGVNYRIVGVCDHDCLDLDLALLDTNGVEVTYDVLDDALPILNHVADTTAEYTVEVMMIACMVEPCAFHIRTYAHDEASGSEGKTFSGNLLSHETYDGELTPEDEHVDDTYMELFQVEARAGERIVLDLRSEEFDTLVRLVPPSGKAAENDDYGTDMGHSHIEFLATTSGTYAVQVTSYTDFATGSFVLQVAVIQ